MDRKLFLSVSLSTSLTDGSQVSLATQQMLQRGVGATSLLTLGSNGPHDGRLRCNCSTCSGSTPKPRLRVSDVITSIVCLLFPAGSSGAGVHVSNMIVLSHALKAEMDCLDTEICELLISPCVRKPQSAKSFLNP